MATWFTADLHLGHGNIIDYCRRPFADVDAMNRALIDNWNEVVAETLPRVADLSGFKILLAGNHDRCWAGHGQRAVGWTERYLDAGFSEVVHGSATVALDDRTVLACHFPYRGDSHDHDRFVRHRPVDKGAWLLHGHVHERWAQHGRMINVGVDATGFRPINAMTVLELINAGPMNSLTPASS